MRSSAHEDSLGGAGSRSCTLCGFRSPGPFPECKGCSFRKSCTVVHCPNCGYRFVDGSLLAGWIAWGARGIIGLFRAGDNE